MENQNQFSSGDHDKITKLVESVASLEKGQDRIEKSQESFHVEIKGNFKELIDNYVTQVEYIETVRIQRQHDNDIKTLQESRWRIVGATSAITGILSIAGSYIINILVK